MKQIAKLPLEIADALDLNTSTDVVMMSDGLEKRLKKRNHHNVLSYLEVIDQWIESPDFIGINPRVINSFECVRVLDENTLSCG